jgi:hypothetical protein
MNHASPSVFKSREFVAGVKHLRDIQEEVEEIMLYFLYENHGKSGCLHSDRQGAVRTKSCCCQVTATVTLAPRRGGSSR